jgi:hypothetical protein
MKLNQKVKIAFEFFTGIIRVHPIYRLETPTSGGG